MKSKKKQINGDICHIQGKEDSKCQDVSCSQFDQ